MAWSMAGKNWTHVALQHIAEAAGELLAAVQGAVGALAHPVGIAVVDEAALEDRLDDVAQGMVHHPVAKGRGADQPPLGLVDVEASRSGPGR